MGRLADLPRPRALLALVLLAGAPALARRPPPKAAAADANTQAAVEALNHGIERFERGDMSAARDSFVRARDLVPDKPKPYYWLARAHIELGHCDDALPSLEEFLRRVPPEHANFAHATALRTRCQGEVAAAAARERAARPPAVAPAAPVVVAAEPAPALAPAPAPSSSRRALRNAGLGLLVGGAVVAIGGGTAFGLMAHDQAAQVVDQANRGVPFNPTLEDSGRLYQNLSIVAISVGAAVAVTGGVLAVLGYRGERAGAAAHIAVGPLVGGGHAGLVAQGAF